MTPVLALMRRSALAATVMVSVGLGTTAARADAIDGGWCRENSHFLIEGPQITTPSGTRMQGDYNRHGFRYTVPADEPEAGVDIVMTLISEEALEVVRRSPGKEASAPEMWRRCRVTS